jgi:hypothetical protein
MTGTLEGVVSDMGTKILPNFFEFGDGAYVLQRVTVLNQYTDEDGETEVLVTEELGEVRSDDDTLVVVYHDYNEE